MLCRGTDAQLHTFNAANRYEQFDSCNNVSDVKMTSPTLGGGNAYRLSSSYIPPPLYILVAYPMVTDCNARVQAIPNKEIKVITFLRGDCF